MNTKWIILILAVTLSRRVVSEARAYESYRMVDGKVYLMSSPEWTTFTGEHLKVIYLYNRFVECQRFTVETVDTSRFVGRQLVLSSRNVINYGGLMCLTNHPNMRKLDVGTVISPTSPPLKLMQVGNVLGVALFDYGIPYTPPERVLSAEELQAAKKRAAGYKADSDAKLLKFHQEKASAGDAYGQFRMGEHYLKGDGVEKDLNKAREYFAKSAAQGNEDTKAALQKLPH